MAGKPGKVGEFGSCRKSQGIDQKWQNFQQNLLIARVTFGAMLLFSDFH